MTNLAELADTLADGQWFWSAGMLYYRDSSADPATSGALYEAGARSHGTVPIPRHAARSAGALCGNSRAVRGVTGDTSAG